MTTEKIESTLAEALGDHTSSGTKSARKFLYTFCALAVLLGSSSTPPNKLSLLGLSFDSLPPMAIDIVVVMLLLFSLLSFAISGFRDFMRWNHYADKFHGARANHAYSEMLTPPDDYSRQEQEFHEEEYREMTGYKGWEIPKKIAGRTMWMTLLLEFRLPPVIALISLLYYIVMRAT